MNFRQTIDPRTPAPRPRSFPDTPKPRAAHRGQPTAQRRDGRCAPSGEMHRNRASSRVDPRLPGQTNALQRADLKNASRAPDLTNLISPGGMSGYSESSRSQAMPTPGTMPPHRPSAKAPAGMTHPCVRIHQPCGTSTTEQTTKLHRPPPIMTHRGRRRAAADDAEHVNQALPATRTQQSQPRGLTEKFSSPEQSHREGIGKPLRQGSPCPDLQASSASH
jgi:hypothetical protein